MIVPRFFKLIKLALIRIANRMDKEASEMRNGVAPSVMVMPPSTA